MKAIEKLIKFLTQRFDKTDEIFRVLIGDENGEIQYIDGLPPLYERAIDQNLNYPSGEFDTAVIPIFALDTAGKAILNVGQNRWETSGSFPQGIWSASHFSLAYGSVWLSPTSGETWDTFLDPSYNGTLKMSLPRTTNGGTGGGYITPIYNNSALQYAFSGTSSNIVIASNNSIYKDEILANKLVLRFDNKTGPAGAVTPDVLTDSIPDLDASEDYNQGAIANELEWMMRFIEQTTKASDINYITDLEAVVWEEITGIQRMSGETIPAYIAKVLGIIAGRKETPYGIITTMERYTDVAKVFESSIGIMAVDYSYVDYGIDGPNNTPAIIGGGAGSDVLRIKIQLKENAYLLTDAGRNVVIDVLRRTILPGVQYSIELVP